jgi:predicted transcriptional regulator
MHNFLGRGFRTPGEAASATLGTLERQVMEHLWQAGHESSVRQVQQAFRAAVAYTTLMTTLDRLYKKGLLHRRKQRRAFLYRPRVSPEQLQVGVARGVLESLLAAMPGATRPVLSTLVDAVGRRDRQMLDELARLVGEKRRQLAEEG